MPERTPKTRKTRAGAHRDVCVRVRFRSPEGASVFIRSLWPDHKPHIRGSSLRRDGEYRLFAWEMKTPAHAPALLEHVRSHPAVAEIEELSLEDYMRLSAAAFQRERLTAENASQSGTDRI